MQSNAERRWQLNGDWLFVSEALYITQGRNNGWHTLYRQRLPSNRNAWYTRNRYSDARRIQHHYGLHTRNSWASQLSPLQFHSDWRTLSWSQLRNQCYLYYRFDRKRPLGVITGTNSSTSITVWLRTTIGTASSVLQDGSFYLYTVP